MSLRRRFILVFVSFAVAMTALSGWAAWTVTRETIEEEIDQKLLWTLDAAVLSGAVQEDLFVPPEIANFWYADPNPTREVFRSMKLRFDEIGLMDRTGLVGGSDDWPMGRVLDWWMAAYRDDLERAYRLAETVTDLEFGEDGEPYKYVIRKLGDSEIFLVARAAADYRDPLIAFRNRIIAITTLAALVAAFLAWRLATGVIQPMSRLSRAATRIQRGRLDRPVDMERADELGQLSRAMERMRMGILERDEQLRLMLAQVAHEIRNPLGGVELFAAAAAETEDEADRNRLLARIRGEVAGLEEIIGDFLTFARPVQPSDGLTDVRGPLEEAAELVERELGARGGTLETSLPARPLHAEIHPDQVKRVALNLLRNAAQAGDHVRMRAEWVGGEILISVRDDGPGVPEELRARIFDPFVTDKEQGAGLGLAIVRQIAEANGGRVELAPKGPSSGGDGAEFHVYFRGAEDLPPDEIDPPAGAAALTGLTDPSGD